MAIQTGNNCKKSLHGNMATSVVNFACFRQNSYFVMASELNVTLELLDFRIVDNTGNKASSVLLFCCHFPNGVL